MCALKLLVYQVLETMSGLNLPCLLTCIAIYNLLQNKKFHDAIYCKCYIIYRAIKNKKPQRFFSLANPPY